MKGSTLKILIGLGVVLLIIIIIVVVVNANKNKEEGNNNTTGGPGTGTETEIDETLPPDYVLGIPGKEFVKMNGGIKENTSALIAKEKKLDGLVFSGMKLTCENGVSTITGTITNKTGRDIKEVGRIYIKLKDKEGRVAQILSVEKMSMANGETQIVSASVTSDVVNAYDVEFSKQK